MPEMVKPCPVSQGDWDVMHTRSVTDNGSELGLTQYLLGPRLCT